MTADELISTLEENESTVIDGIPYCVIDPDDRTIAVPESEKFFGVTNDKDVERRYFICPKVVGDNIDLSQHQIYVAYAYASNETTIPEINDGLYNCEDVEVSGDNITFSWKLSDNVFAMAGFIVFKVMAKKMDGNILKTKWNTLPAYGTVLMTLPDGTQIESQYPDILTQILDRLDILEHGSGGGTVDPEQIKQAVNGYLEENPPSGMTAEQEQQLEQNTTDVADLKGALEQIESGGWSSTQIDLFEAFTNVIAYTSPDANSIVSSLISSLRSGSSDTPEGSFSIIYVLSNVTSSSKDNSIKSGEPYNTTLTANPGYELNSVIVKMGGSDITSTAYSDGEITISAVTGNIVITASAVQSSASGQLPQDSLVAYFDFRNATPEINAQQGFTKFNANQGNGCLFTWSASAFTSSDDYGVKNMIRALMFDKDGGTNQSELGTSFSMLFKGYDLINGAFVSNDHARVSSVAAFSSAPKYNTSSSQVQVGAVGVGDMRETSYIDVYFVVDSSSFKLYINGKLAKTYNGTDYEGFVSWYSKVATMVFGNGNYQTALALYEKALSEVEIVEALEFFKTLEVSE